MATSQPSSTEGSQPKDVNERDMILLAHVADELVRFGQKIGVTPEEMISLLDSGISIPDLLAFLASKASGAA